MFSFQMDSSSPVAMGDEMFIEEEE